MIKKCLYIEFASLRHDLIGLHLLGLFIKTRDVGKWWMDIQPGGKKHTETTQDMDIVSK